MKLSLLLSAYRSFMNVGAAKVCGLRESFELVASKELWTYGMYCITMSHNKIYQRTQK